jgi:hypothetical protein
MLMLKELKKVPTTRRLNSTQLRYRDALEAIFNGCDNPSQVAGEALRNHRRDNATDLTGLRFGKLEALFYAGMRTRPEGKSRRRRSTWLCWCDCGKFKIVEGNALKSGGIKSCGCAREEFLKYGRNAGKHRRRNGILHLPGRVNAELGRVSDAAVPAKAEILGQSSVQLDAA